MNHHVVKMLKYEFLNIFRSGWIFVYGLLWLSLTFIFLRISGDFKKTLMSVGTVAVTLIPLATGLFSSLYWYYNERFTHLMLTQPLPRLTLFWSRYFALTIALAGSMAAGLMLPFLFYGEISAGLILTIFVGAFLTAVFVALSLWFCAYYRDRMKGMGAILGTWVYFALLHDGLLLFILIFLKDYPMDLPGALLGVASPMGLSRVVLIMHNDSALLLGYSGALVRNILTTSAGYLLAVCVSVLWLALPLGIGRKIFVKSDY